MASYQIHGGDFVQWLDTYNPDESGRFHALLADPPYALIENSKRFSSPDSAAPDPSYAGGAYTRQAKGFMGQSWDGFASLLDYQRWVTSWAVKLPRVMYPGAVGGLFGGSRTYHRLAVGLEDAGLEVFDVIMWVYGSGMPKSLNIGRAIDRRAGLIPSKIKRVKLDGTPSNSTRPGTSVAHNDFGDKDLSYGGFISDEAKRWGGHGTLLKPAYEPLILFRVPRGKSSFIDLAKNYQTGALNLDAARVPGLNPDESYNEAGRFPSNVLFTHSPNCFPDHCAPGCPVSELDRQSGQTERVEVREKKPSGSRRMAFGFSTEYESPVYGDAGGASRFFYTGKASTQERFLPSYRSPRADLKPAVRAQLAAKMRDSVEPLFGSKDIFPRDSIPFSLAAKFEPSRATHPTVKPIGLIEYLAKMFLPPAGGQEPRRLLIPFSGVGSEMIGAHFAGWDEIQGIELTPEYIPQALDRLQWWTKYASYELAQLGYNQRQKAITELQKAITKEESRGLRRLLLFPDMESPP